MHHATSVMSIAAFATQQMLSRLVGHFPPTYPSHIARARCVCIHSFELKLFIKIEVNACCFFTSVEHVFFFNYGLWGRDQNNG